MPLHRLLVIAIASAALLVPTVAQEDAIGAPGPIVFEQTRFELAWTSHPTPTYYKQEYLPQGQALESYGEMFMVDMLTEGATPESAAADMIAGLEQRKASDPVVNYDMIANEATGEIIFDFLLSDASGDTVIVEWNAYRYVPLGDSLALFAISRRGYGDDASAFIGSLKDWRSATIQSLAVMDLPDIALD
ncbi:hypothetical protein [Devosia sp.]|uniref:hypothetical protein n=1 Tax=Devosia sp. TaxID=1871048 RepID=UPI002FC8013F